MKHLVGRAGEIAEVKRARLVAHYHPAVTWNIAVHLATAAKCQSGMKHGHTPVIVMIFYKVRHRLLVERVRERKLASRQEPLVDRLLQKRIAVFPRLNLPRRLVAVLALCSVDLNHALLTSLNALIMSMTLLTGHG